MAVTVIVTKITIEPGGRILADFNGRGQREFASIAHLREHVQALDTGEQAANNAELMALAYVLARSPDLSSTSTIVGKTFTFDLSHAQPIRVL